MSLLTVFLVICAVGFLLWVVDRPQVPMSPESKQLLKLVTVVFVLFWLLAEIGAFAALEKVKV